ncbi:MAG: hypothetical protein KC443_07025 [Anaerolineales bacterium]|nr:hypothetical protein [Anaerolineales bacterium]
MTKRFIFIITALSVTFLAVMWQVAPAYGSPLVVIGDGTAVSCQTEAAANAFSDAVAAGGTIDFDCGSELVVMNVNTNVTDQQVTVNGNGRIVLSGEGLRQIFLLTGSANLTLNDLTLQDGSAGQGGAIAIEPQASATINRSFFTSNEAATVGGAIYNQGTLTINQSTLGSNVAFSHGGALYNSGGTVDIYDSYIISNQAENGDGGGLLTYEGAMTLERTAVRSNISANHGGGLSASTDMQIINVTFSNNHALLGGALYSGQSGQTINIVNSTFNENQADTAGAIYRHSASTVVVKNSILTGSLNTNGSSPSLNCDGPSLVSLGHNIISDNSCFPNPGTVDDLFGTDPLLGPWLASPIRAYIPNANSPAVDYGLDCPAVDQRGYPRPLGAACDVGSIERGQLLYLPLIVR